MCGGAPSAPDPYAVSNAQTQSNVTTANTQAALNAVDQYNPFGSDTFLRNAQGDPYGQVSSVSQPIANLIGGQEGIASGLQGFESQIGQNLNPGTVNTDFGAQTNAAQEGAFASAMGLLQPQFDLQNNALDTQLTDRGIPMGSETWNNATEGLQLPQDAAMTSAAGQAIGAGNQEQAQLFNQSLQANQLPYQNLQTIMGLNPASSLISSVPGAQQTSATTVQPTNVSGNVYQSYADQLAAYNQQMNNTTSALTGLATLGLSPQVGAGLGLGSSSIFGSLFASDENLKENREPADGEHILALFREMPAEHYDYKKEAQDALGVPEHRTGIMAQDYAKHFGGDGHTIDLADFAGHMLAAIQALDERTRGDERKAA